MGRVRVTVARRLAVALTAALALTGCGGEDAAVQLDGPPPPASVASVQPPPVRVPLVVADGRYGTDYWGAERLTRLEAAKNRYSDALAAAAAARRASSSTGPTAPPAPPPPEPTVTPTPAPSSDPDPTPDPAPEPDEEPEPTGEPDPEPSATVLASWICAWQDDGKGARAVDCMGELDPDSDHMAVWSCVGTPSEEGSGDSSCTGTISPGEAWSWACAWDGDLGCSLDAGEPSWSCTWEGNWGTCVADAEESEEWFCLDFRDPEGNQVLCEAMLDRSLPMSAMALPAIWRLSP